MHPTLDSVCAARCQCLTDLTDRASLPLCTAWAFVENGTFYVYYLVIEHSLGEGFGVARSADGQHWDDHGMVFTCPGWADHRWWCGSGSVWWAPDFSTSGRYLMNWSQDPTGRRPYRITAHTVQEVKFGESFDLVRWRPVPNATFATDERHYKRPGRWDGIYTLPANASDLTPHSRIRPGAADGYPRHGYWTASPQRRGAGCIGWGITDDGIRWTALPSPLMVPPIIG